MQVNTLSSSLQYPMDTPTLNVNAVSSDSPTHKRPQVLPYRAKDENGGKLKDYLVNSFPLMFQ